MINQIFNQDCFKIIALFSLSPGSRHNRKFIQGKTRLNNVPLDKALQRLISSNILKKEKFYYFIDFEENCSKKFIDLCNVSYKQLKELPLEIYFLLVDLINEASKMRCLEIYLFGSYAKLVYNKNSDIDFALVHNKQINKKLINDFVLKLEKKYNKKIEIHYFESNEFYKNKKDPLVKSIIKDGVKLL